ncbi:MAG: hypothetical protein CSA24_02105 [Deltaproteobacteria bacterium]|nr:MAG: hypothetical protein CSA24_02105 [Deltaproteobacteria bacterium]
MAWEASRFIDAGDLKMAKQRVRQALAADQKSADARFHSARIAFLEGDLPAALQAVNVALSIDERHRGALLLLVHIQQAQGRPDASRGRLQSLANTYRDDLGVQLAYGELQLAAGEHAGARKAATRVLKKAETSVAAMKLMARVYLGLERPGTAEYVLQRAIELRRDPEALLLLARIRLDEGKIVQARVLLEEAVNKVPGYLEAMNTLGVVYVDVRNFQAAADILQRVIKAAPAFAEAWLNLGSAQRGLGQFEGAEQSWRKVLSLNGELPQAWFNLGVLYLDNPLPGRDRIKQLGEAINAFQGYKSGGRQGVDPNVDKYIGEARLLLKQEQERRKEQLKQPPADDGAPPADDGGEAT